MTTRNVENIDINLPNLIYALWKKLKEQRKIQIIFLFCFVLASAFSEVFSLGSVLPFLYVLINPIGLWNLTFFRNIFIFLGINNPNYLLLPMTVIFCLCIVFAAFFRLVTIWLNCRLSAAIGSDLSCEVFTRTIFQPYKYHLERNSSELIAAINIHIPQSIYSINLFFKLISNAIIASSIIIALLIINLKIALSLIIVFGFAYLLISIFIKNKLAANSLFAVNATQNQLSIIQESLGGIRDLIIDQNFNYYI